MVPAQPIVPGLELPVTVIAKDQPPYKPLAAYITSDGYVLVRWRLSLRERLRLLCTGNLYHWINTNYKPLQPVYLSTKYPVHAK